MKKNKARKLSINKNPYIRSFPYHTFIDIACNNDLTNSSQIAEFEILNEKINFWNVYTSKLKYDILDNKVCVFSNPYEKKNNFKIYRKIKENDEITVKINKHLFTNAWSNISIFICDSNKLKEIPDFEENAPIVIFSRGIGYGFYMHIAGLFHSLFKTRKLIFPYYIRIKTTKSTISFSFRDKEDWKELTTLKFTYCEKNCLGIDLNIADNQYYNWIYTNFINLQGNLDDSVRLDWLNTPKRNYKFYTVNPILTFEYIEWEMLHSNKIFECIRNNIDNNKYIEVYLNEKYIKNTLCYQKYDFIHENLCYGYDKDNKLIFLINIRDGKPNLIEVYIDDFMKGFLHNNNNNFVHTLKYNVDEAYYRFNKKYMILNLRQYLKGANISENFGFCSNIENKTYGIALCDLLTTEEGMLKLLEDKRISFLIYEHKKIMRDRVHFLYERKEIGDDDYLKLYSAFQDNLNNSELLLMLVLKNSIKPINDINSKINNLIELIKNNEIKCINELIISIEKCTKNED